MWWLQGDVNHRNENSAYSIELSWRRLQNAQSIVFVLLYQNHKIWLSDLPHLFNFPWQSPVLPSTLFFCFYLFTFLRAHASSSSKASINEIHVRACLQSYLLILASKPLTLKLRKWLIACDNSLQIRTVNSNSSP